MAASAASSCGFHHTEYENPITKDTQQPDKVLYDKAIKDLEKGRYELARLTLNTLINTYDTSEYLAKAKLAIADSWYREGGAPDWRKPKRNTRTSSCSTPPCRKPPKRSTRFARSTTAR